jgi:hypothetical protein
MIVHKEEVTFIPYQDNMPYISEVQLVEIPNHESNARLSKELPEINKEEELSVIIEDYHIANNNIECIGLQSFAPNWYRDIKSKKDIERTVQRLEDIQIIGEIPMNHWDKNSIVCKINIINPDCIIKTCPIEATPKDIE